MCYRPVNVYIQAACYFLNFITRIKYFIYFTSPYSFDSSPFTCSSVLLFLIIPIDFTFLVFLFLCFLFHWQRIGYQTRPNRPHYRVQNVIINIQVINLVIVFTRSWITLEACNLSKSKSKFSCHSESKSGIGLKYLMVHNNYNSEIKN